MNETKFAESAEHSTSRDAMFLLFRHKRKMAWFLGATVVLVGAFTLLSPSMYESRATLLVRLGRESVTLDPTAATSGQVIAPARQSFESEVNSEMELLRSRELAEKVVDALGPAAFFVARFPWQSSPEPRTGPAGAASRDRAVGRFMKGLQVDLAKGSNVIGLSYEARTASLAQEGLSKLIDAYLEKHIQVYRTQGSYEFFRDQTEQARTALALTEASLRDLKNRTGVASLSEQRQILLNRIGVQQEELAQTRAALAASTARIRSLEAQIKTIPRTVVLQETSVPNQAMDGMQKALYDLKLKEQDLLSRYNAESEPVREVRRQISEAQAILDAEKPTRAQVTEGLNRTHEDIASDLLVEKANAEGLQAKLRVLEADAAKLRTERDELNDTETRLAQLQRQRATQETSYQEYATKLEHARIDQALQRDRISNISVVQPPIRPAKPIRPRAALNLTLAVCIGFLGALGLAFVAEYLDHSIKRPEDVADKLHMPLLVTVPEVPSTDVLPRPRGKDKAEGVRPTEDKARWVPSDCEVPRALRDSFDILRDRIFLLGNEALQPPCLIALTSCHRGEGVSTVASNLAATLARSMTGRVLLVDGNVVRNFEGDRPATLPMRLLGSANPHIGGEAIDFFRAKSLAALLPQLKNDYDIIVFDAAAILDSAAAMRIANLVDGVVLVVEAERVRWEVVRQAKEVLARANAKVLGVVLNKRRYHVPEWLYRRL